MHNHDTIAPQQKRSNIGGQQRRIGDLCRGKIGPHGNIQGRLTLFEQLVEQGVHAGLDVLTLYKRQPAERVKQQD